MTEPPTDNPALDRWLGQQHAQLVARVAASMDLEAGFRETVIRARHQDLVDDLHADLAAAAASLHRDTSRATAITADDVGGRGEQSLACQLATLPPADRMTLRTHVQPLLDHASEYAFEAAQESVTDRSVLEGCHLSLHNAVTTEVVLDWGRYVYLVGFRLNCAYRLLRKAPKKVARARAHGTRVKTSGDAMDWVVDVRNLFCATINGLQAVLTLWGEVLPDPEAGRPVDPVRRARGYSAGSHDLLVALADDLESLCQAMDNFAGADLRNLDLSQVRLHGLRWSGETQWDPEVYDSIRPQSVALGNGLWEIRDGSESAPVARQPVSV